MRISIETKVKASLSDVWSAWTTPEDITRWNFASDEWCCPRATIDLRPNGKFSYRMESKDGSMGFDFSGKFSAIEEKKLIELHLEDNRLVKITFTDTSDGILIEETFEVEDENSAKQQKEGWQAILNNFKKHAESKKWLRDHK